MSIYRYHLSLPGWLPDSRLATVFARSQQPENLPSQAPNLENFIKLGIQQAVAPKSKASVEHDEARFKLRKFAEAA